ncbi:MAG: hypothetical protein IMW89_18155 [Ktedonobacteraceae bacterium]|nr:hypothetical protein [Ktedonobacteraceae bacterium]
MNKREAGGFVRFTIVMKRLLLVASSLTFLVLGVIDLSPVRAVDPLPVCADPPPAAVPPADTPVTPSPVPGVVLINEVLTSPGRNWECTPPDPATPFKAWAELYNPSDQPLDLHAAHTIIEREPPGSNTRYLLPLGTIIAAHGFLVTFFPADSAISRMRLLMGDSEIDTITFPPLVTDQSYARTPDGSTTWQASTMPTIGISNNAAVAMLSPTATDITPTARATSTVRPTATRSARTPTPHVSSREKGSSQKKDQGYNSHTSSSANSNGQVLANGTQPAWQSMQLSSDNTDQPSTVPTSSASTILSPSHQQDSNQSGKILFSLLAILVVIVALILFWGRKFLPGRPSPPPSSPPPSS